MNNHTLKMIHFRMRGEPQICTSHLSMLTFVDWRRNRKCQQGIHHQHKGGKVIVRAIDLSCSCAKSSFKMIRTIALEKQNPRSGFYERLKLYAILLWKFSRPSGGHRRHLGNVIFFFKFVLLLSRLYLRTHFNNYMLTLILE